MQLTGILISMDLQAADRPVRDQIQINPLKEGWACRCQGCTKARKSEREIILSIIRDGGQLQDIMKYLNQK
jgi:hypothetical protein